MTRVSIEYASPQDWIDFYGEQPEQTVKAIVAKKDGEILGIGGLRFDGEKMSAFSEMTENALKHPIAIIRAGRMLVRMMKDYGQPVLAIADPNHEKSAQYLEHLGFTFMCDSPDGKVYQWQ